MMNIQQSILFQFQFPMTDPPFSFAVQADSQQAALEKLLRALNTITDELQEAITAKAGLKPN
jgi:hypothetical protein